MKSLKEALLNRPKNVDVARMTQTIAEEYINANYNHSGELTFENVNGVWTANCNGDVYVKNNDIEKLTDGFVWGKVKGKFDCSECKNLKSLEGAPKEVDKNFICAWCKSLETLEGAPKKVGNDFNCYDCSKLKTLEGSPKKVDGNFDCSSCNSLTSLEGSPQIVGRDFICVRCGSLKSIEGAPKNCKIICDKKLKKK